MLIEAMCLSGFSQSLFLREVVSCARWLIDLTKCDCQFLGGGDIINALFTKRHLPSHVSFEIINRIFKKLPHRV
jgi:hypothetical protein